MKNLKHNVVIFLFIISVLVGTALLFSQETETTETNDPFEMSFEELMAIKITTAARVPEEIRSIPASVVVITREDIQTYGYTTLKEILANIPGLYFIDDYSENGEKFGVRGFWTGVANDNLIIQVNGIPQVYDPASNYPLDLSPIPVESINRIEVVRGPMSVSYGSGAFFGVINIITANYNNRNTNLVSASVGSEKTKKVVLRLEDQEGEFHYTFNGSYYYNHGLNLPLSSLMTDPTKLADYNLPLDQRTDGQLELDQKYLSISGDFKGVYLNFSYTECNRENYFLLPSFASGTLTQLTSARGSLGYKKRFSEIFSIDGKFDYTHIQDWYKYDLLSPDFYGLQQIKSDAMEIELNSFITPSSSLDIKTGISYRAILDVSNNYDLPSTGSPTLENNYFYLANNGHNGHIVTRAFYAQFTYKPFTKLELVAGIRLEQMPKYKMGAIQAAGTPNYTKAEHIYNEDSLESIPRFAAIFSFNANHAVKLLYGKAANRPSFLQNSRNTFSGGLNDLKPERIQTFELNYIGIISEAITLNTSFFTNNLENLITRVVEFDPDYDYKTWSANAGQMVTKGVEITVQTRPFNHLNLELSATIQKTKDKQKKFENIAVAYSPDFLGYVKASYKYKKLILALTGYYVGRMETFWDETIHNTDGTYGNRIGLPSPGYFDLGANLRIEDFPVKGLFVNAKVSNLANAEIRYPTFTSNSWMDRGSLGPGRQFLINLGCQW